MTSFQVRVEPEAQQDIEEALDWYQEKSQELAQALLEAYQQRLFDLGVRPLSFPEVRPGLRRAMLPRFPYHLFFEMVDEHVIVLAVLHAKRDPQSWP